MRSTTLVAVSVPVISYSTSPHNFNVYAQPAVNPYLFETKNPYLYRDPYPSGFVENYEGYGYSPRMANIGHSQIINCHPPPYKP